MFFISGSASDMRTDVRDLTRMQHRLYGAVIARHAQCLADGFGIERGGFPALREVGAGGGRRFGDALQLHAGEHQRHALGVPGLRNGRQYRHRIRGAAAAIQQILRVVQAQIPHLRMASQLVFGDRSVIATAPLRFQCKPQMPDRAIARSGTILRF